MSSTSCESLLFHIPKDDFRVNGQAVFLSQSHYKNLRTLKFQHYVG
jgi:hypothetical protein